MGTSRLDLARQLGDLLRRVTALERAPRLRNASLESSALNVYDTSGLLKQTIGPQYDGTYTTTDFNGPTPPTPTTPTGDSILEAIKVRWDGLFTNASVAPLDFSRVEIHASTDPTYTAEFADTLVGTIESPRGGWCTIGLSPGTYYIKLVTRSRSGGRSPASAALEISPGPMGFINTDEASIATDGATGSIPLSFTPRTGSEQVYWNGYPLNPANWSISNYVVTIPGQAFFQANDHFRISYAYDTTTPRIHPVITSPANGAVLSSITTTTVSGTGVPGRTIEVFVDGVSGGTATIALDGTWSVTGVPVSLGLRTITATQHEPDGVLVDAAAITVQVNRYPSSRSFGSTGPNLVVAEGSTTDYSAPSLSETSWTVSATPVGHASGGSGSWAGYPTPVTDSGSVNCGIWLRRWISTNRVSTLTINPRADGQWWLYVDGDLLASNATADGWFPTLGPFTTTVLAGDHVIALHVNDDGSDPLGDGIYADLSVSSS